MGEENLGVISTAPLVLDDDLVGGCPDEIGKTDILVFSGNGRPTVSVIGETSAGLRLGSTAVGDDGTWMMEIGANRLDKGDNTIVFEYGNVEQPLNSDSTINVEGSADDGTSVFMWILMVVGALIVLAVLGAVFVFFFVEFEDDYEDDLQMGEVEEVDPYAWAKQGQEQAVAAAPAEVAATPVETVAEAAPAAVSGYPGWKWDAEQNKWIPENE